MMDAQLYLIPESTMREEVTPVQNDRCAIYMKKPVAGTGLWTSAYREETDDSAWVEWCHSETYSNPDRQYWHLLTPRHDARIYTIDGPNDFIALIARYPYVSQELERCLPPRAFFRHYYTGIDFEKLSQDYDGLHLTEEGNAQLHLPFDYDFDMNAWDVESTVWFRWCFEKVECIRTPTIVETKHECREEKEQPVTSIQFEAIL